MQLLPQFASFDKPARSSEAAAIFRRKAIYEQLHPETRHGGNAGPYGRFAHTETESFSQNTASATGKHRATVDRAAARREALEPVRD